MQNFFRMSYFMPPIAPIRNEQGQTVTPATLTPFCEVSVEQVYQMITCNENLKVLTTQVRSTGDLRMAKVSLLPYVTPCGIFSRRSSKFFTSPSGLVVVDIENRRNASYTVRRSFPPPCTRIYQSQQPGCENIRTLQQAVHRRSEPERKREHELGNAIRRNDLRIRNE